MAAYVILEIEITDPKGYEENKKSAGASVAKYGGKYIVRGGATEVLEGDWIPKRIVVLEFDNMQRARDWLHCEEYREPRQMRHRTAKRDSGRRELARSGSLVHVVGVPETSSAGVNRKEA